MPYNGEHIPLIQAGNFAGLKSENVNDFLDQYELAATANKWSNNTKIQLFKAHLTGSPKTWFVLYAKRKNNAINWNELVADFRNAYTYAAQADSLHNIMSKKTQDENEPVLNFFLEIVATCQRYNPNISEEEIIKYFLRAVRPEYCQYLSTLRNDTLERLEHNLLQAEKFVTLNSINKERYAQSRKIAITTLHKKHVRHE